MSMGFEQVVALLSSLKFERRCRRSQETSTRKRIKREKRDWSLIGARRVAFCKLYIRFFPAQMDPITITDESSDDDVQTFLQSNYPRFAKLFEGIIGKKLRAFSIDTLMSFGLQKLAATELYVDLHPEPFSGMPSDVSAFLLEFFPLRAFFKLNFPFNFFVYLYLVSSSRLKPSGMRIQAPTIFDGCLGLLASELCCLSFRSWFVSAVRSRRMWLEEGFFASRAHFASKKDPEHHLQ